VNTKYNQCLDVEGQGTANNTNVFVYDCNSGSNQKWNVNADGTIQTQLDNQCLTVNTAQRIDPSMQNYGMVCGRYSSQARGQPPRAYCLLIDVGTQKWFLRVNTNTIASGNLPSVIHVNEWHTYKISFQGTTIKTYLDNIQLNSVTDNTYGYGMVAIGSGWHEAYFDNFSITPL